MVRQVQTQTSKDEIAEFLRKYWLKQPFCGFRVESLEVVSDHVHVLVSATPQHTIPNMVKMLKGISARKLFLKFPELKKKLWGGHLWNPTYFVSTISENTEAQVRSISKLFLQSSPTEETSCRTLRKMIRVQKAFKLHFNLQPKS